ncbi:MerR family transcriptional regulator [Brevibacterium sp. BRM-1]|uniref:MerR family transcriptional regulator n=1 Tax=Brevibacterium sp. BRM-1 TaxID=2999062 RepID=UPI00227E46D9|nr:MerR family transcriptional regulator [Brevibacterium sp. BRM-1]WAL39533.1 MerR family transcriptional regulator [Brevibacterium sp. BRM-1]
MSSAAEPDEGLTVGATARAVGVSVRALHHWDEIGLVSPSARTWAGYRLYAGCDIARLQRVLVYRELGMRLDEIARVLDDPDVDVAGHLVRQRELLAARIDRLQEMVSAVDRMMEVHRMDERLTPQEQAEAFGSQWDDRYAQEAQERWGDTPEWEQSERVKAQLSAADWERVRAEAESFEEDLAAAFAAGTAPGSPAANALAERHFAQIGQWFDMTHQKQVLIATGYVQDPRYVEYYDRLGAGLTAWLKEVIDANARAHGVDPQAARWE